MKTPARSKLGRRYDYRPPHSQHKLLLGAMEPSGLTTALPESVDWRPVLTPVRDQGHEGACFAFAAAALKEANCAFWGGGTAPLGGYLSPAYLAWRVRSAEGTFPSDSGASLADTMEVLRAWGVCPEAFVPYTGDASARGDAASDVAAEPYRVHLPAIVDFGGATALKRVLASKRVIALGFAVYPSFEATGPDGIVQPVGQDEGLIGGHAVLLCGYDARGWLIRNSWGTGWGDAGYARMPYGYEAHWFEAWTTA